MNQNFPTISWFWKEMDYLNSIFVYFSIFLNIPYIYVIFLFYLILYFLIFSFYFIILHNLTFLFVHLKWNFFKSIFDLPRFTLFHQLFFPPQIFLIQRTEIHVIRISFRWQTNQIEGSIHFTWSRGRDRNGNRVTESKQVFPGLWPVIDSRVGKI